MKRVKRRALSALLLAAVAIIGLGVYVVRFLADGGSWASAFAGPVGTVTDRKGELLSAVKNGRRVFAENADVRKAALHAVGDADGFIGTGALAVYAPQMSGYNPVTGLYSRVGASGTVRLTIDAELNVAAYKALNGRRGAVMAMDYRTGEILCMVSSPAYDPNSPPKDIEDDPNYEGVYLNRAISAVYTPGSVFKLVTVAAAIENIRGLDDRAFVCDGSIKAGTGTITCPKAHGKMSFEDALAVSCNGAFAELSLELGSGRLAQYSQKYGLSESLEIGKLLTAKGNFDKAEPGTDALAWSGIGQYTNTVCPAAMLRLAGAVANGGVAVPMRLTAETGLFSSSGSRIMKAETAERLGEMMNYNTRHSYGEKNFPGLTLHAKSGTAEVGGDAKPHAWFVGYTTNEDTPLAFAVVVENGGGGALVAGEVANKVLQNLHKK